MKYIITWVIMSAVVSYSKTYKPHYKTTEDKFGRKHSVFVVDSAVKRDTVFSDKVPKKKYFSNPDSAHLFYKEIIAESKKTWTWYMGIGSGYVCYADGTPIDKYQGQSSSDDYSNIICCIRMDSVNMWASKRKP